MALADTARLIASLELQDKFSSTASKFDRTVGQMDRRTQTLDRIGTHIGQGIRNTTQNLGRLAIIGGGVIASQVAVGVRSLAALEEAQAQTAARIEATGGAANVTAEQVRGLSEEIENLSTVDDKAIQAGANMLLTFRNIRNEVGAGNDIFDQATLAVVNLSVAMGSEPQQAALQLGKALNDPVRGLTALRRVGVQFTDEQEKQIRTLVEAGRVMDAQKIILRELTQEFGGSAEAFGRSGPGATMRRFADAVEDGQQALARGFLPLMEKVAGLAQEAFADPKVIAGITNFGEGLAGGLDQLIGIAQKLPWSAIGSSLQIAGTGAKAVLNAFTSLPPWIQTAVLTGWGLNKLTGGALGGLAGTLFKGLMPGGGLRGATPATPLFTKEVGLGGAAGGTPAAGAKGGGLLAGAAKFVLGPLAAVAIGAEIAAAINQGTIKPAADFEEGAFTAVLDSKDTSKLVAGLSAIERAQNDPRLLEQTALIASNIPFIGDALGQVGPKLEEQRQQLIEQLKAQGYTTDQITAMIAKLETLRAQSSAFASSTTSRWSAEQREAYAQMNATRDVAMKTSALGQRMVEARQATQTGFQASNSLDRESIGVQRVIANKNFSPSLHASISVVSNVTISEIQRRVTSAQIAIGRGPLETFD